MWTSQTPQLARNLRPLLERSKISGTFKLSVIAPFAGAADGAAKIVGRPAAPIAVDVLAGRRDCKIRLLRLLVRVSGLRDRGRILRAERQGRRVTTLDDFVSLVGSVLDHAGAHFDFKV